MGEEGATPTERQAVAGTAEWAALETIQAFVAAYNDAGRAGWRLRAGETAARTLGVFEEFYAADVR